MLAWIEIIRRMALVQCQRGATAVEYALIIALICLAIITAMSSVATKTIGIWNNVSTQVLSH